MKKRVLWVLLDLVFVVIFNFVFFIAGNGKYNLSAWISYAFIHVAYIMIVITPLLIHKSCSSAVFGFSIYVVSSVYFFIEFVIGLIFIFLNLGTVQSSIIVQVIAFGIYAVILISTLLSNEKTSESITRQKKEVEYIKMSSSRVELLIETANGKKAKKEIEKVYDLLHSSPTKSNQSVYFLEKEIIDRITELEDSVSVNDESSIIALCNKIVSLTNERNRKIQSLQ